VHSQVRDGNKLIAEGDADALRPQLASVRAMLSILGLDPMAEGWRDVGAASPPTGVVDALVRALLAEREDARARKDFGAADAIRDRLRAAGVEVEDTASGPRWTLSR
jgi:cysteinyl-tRNA synthetase